MCNVNSRVCACEVFRVCVRVPYLCSSLWRGRFRFLFIAVFVFVGCKQNIYKLYYIYFYALSMHYLVKIMKHTWEINQQRYTETPHIHAHTTNTHAQSWQIIWVRVCPAACSAPFFDSYGKHIHIRAQARTHTFSEYINRTSVHTTHHAHTSIHIAIMPAIGCGFALGSSSRRCRFLLWRRPLQTQTHPR